MKDIENTGDYTFYGCTDITDVYIPNGVKTIGFRAFSGCKNIKNIKLSNTLETIGTEAFFGLYSLESVNLPNSLKTISVNSFSQCTKVSAITIPSGVTSIMTGAFSNCSALTNLNIVSDNTKYDSRNNCNAIIETNNNVLVIGCKSTVIPNTVTRISYRAFLLCGSLEQITIPSSVTYIGDGAFYQCSSLKTVIMESPTPPTLGGTSVFDGNASGRKIYVPAESLNTYKTATNWSEYEADIEGYIDYKKKHLRTTALESGTISFNIWRNMGTDYITSISYSTDGGSTWTTTQNQNNKQSNIVITVNVSQGDKILWKGIARQTGFHDYDYDDEVGSFFNSTARFNVDGNVMSLLYGDNFVGEDILEYDYQFARLFDDVDDTMTKVVDASNLILPATTLSIGCYKSMFGDCSELLVAPELPATTLSQSCYQYMFMECGKLETAPELPATTLASNCYEYMFDGCTSLITAPELPATTLANYCYRYMFKGCTNLNYIKAMFTTTPDSTYTSGWVSGVSATGTFVKNSAATWNVTGNSGVPTGWTVQTASS